MNKLWPLYTMAYYLITTLNGIPIHTTTWTKNLGTKEKSVVTRDGGGRRLDHKGAQGNLLWSFNCLYVDFDDNSINMHLSNIHESQNSEL